MDEEQQEQEQEQEQEESQLELQDSIKEQEQKENSYPEPLALIVPTEEDRSICIFCTNVGAIDSKADAVCITCHYGFCNNHRSKQSMLHCQNCFRDVQVKDSKLVREKTRFSVNQDKFIVRKETCRQIQFSGEAWRKHEQVIATLSDEELHNAIEITRASVILMEQELLVRNIDKARKQALKDSTYEVKSKKAFALGSDSQRIPTGTGIRVSATTTRKLVLQKPNDFDLNKALRKMVTPEILRDMISKLEGKVVQ
jgi:hypothetical protein